MSSNRKTNKASKAVVSNKFRESLLKHADEFVGELLEKKNIIVNVSSMHGLGKTQLLHQILPQKLDVRGIIYLNIDIIPLINFTELAINILDWISKSLLQSSPKIDVSGLQNNLEGVEENYSDVYTKLSKLENKIPFGLLIDNFDDLTSDEQEWFQSVIIETLSSISQSMIIISSHNELNWHSWELRNRCKRIRLEAFSLKEIEDICSSGFLAQRILDFSAGHPSTVIALLEIAINIFSDLTKIQESDIKKLNPVFLKELEVQINKSILSRTTADWLNKVIWLCGAVDDFDADIVNEVVRAFEIEIPEDVTDIAWEIAYTGLASWNFEDKAYKMVPELQGRIKAYLKHVLKEDYKKIMECVSNSYLARAKFMKDPDVQLLKSIYYLALTDQIQNKKLTITSQIQSSIKQVLKTTEERESLYDLAVNNEKINQMPEASRIYSAILGKEEDDKEEIMKTLPQNDLISAKIKPEQKLFNIYEPRENEEKEFNDLITGKLDNKWILSLHGMAGLGKSRLLDHLFEIANEKGYAVALLDLHYRRNRRLRTMLRELIDQLNLKDADLEDAMKKLEDAGVGGADYIGSGPKESFEEASRVAASAMAKALNHLVVTRKQRSVILIDTFDNDNSISYLAAWLFNELVSKLDNSVYFVIAGRKSMESVWNISNEILEINKSVEMLPLDYNSIQSMALKFKSKSEGLRGKLGEKIADLSQGNPLVVAWLLFYHSRFPIVEELDRLNKEEILDILANWMLDKFDYTTRVMRAAAHFGSHFNLELFKSVIPSSQIEGDHNSVFNELVKYFYTRGTIENWTLHDEIRARILKAIRERGAQLAELSEFSHRAVENYYDPKIDELKRRRPLNPDDQAELEDLQAERFYHLLFSKGKETYRDLWDHFDNLWHRFRLEQMAHVIQFGREVQDWKRDAGVDKLLKNLLDSAEAWMYYSQGNIEAARELAKSVVNSSDDDYKPPRRLYATALVVLGFTTQNPEEAIGVYLEPAQKIYQELRSELEKDGVLANNEFCDKLADVYQELHMVLLQIGKMQWQYFHNLDRGERALKEAYEMAGKESWNKPLYQATALNEWARIRRFKGDFNDAFNKAVKAIAIYEENNWRDINLGIFYETLGLIYKANEQYDQALDQFQAALSIYKDIQGPVEKFESTVNLEIGHVFFLKKSFVDAEKYYQDAYVVTKSLKKSRLYYYLSNLNKLAELNLGLYEEDKNNDHLTKAMNILKEQKELAADSNYDLWTYWSNQYLAEIDFEQNGLINKESLKATLDNLLKEFDKRLHREFGPAFWQTKLLLYKISIKEEDRKSAMQHLAEGLSYLATTWKIRFNRNLGLLRNELLQLDTKQRALASKELILFWTNRFVEEDPAPEFIEMCKAFTSQ